MATEQREIQEALSRKYSAGFVTDIESDTADLSNTGLSVLRGADPQNRAGAALDLPVHALPALLSARLRPLVTNSHLRAPDLKEPAATAVKPVIL